MKENRATKGSAERGRGRNCVYGGIGGETVIFHQSEDSAAHTAGGSGAAAMGAGITLTAMCPEWAAARYIRIMHGENNLKEAGL